MGPHDDSVVNNLETFDYGKARDCNNTNILDASRCDSNDELNTTSWLDEKDFVDCKENNSNLEQDGEDLEEDGEEDDEEIRNLFKLSVLFVRGNPFDSLKHWRMRCNFLDANIRIGSLGRIREIDEAFLNISEKERCSSPKQGVRFIQVQPKEGETLRHDGGHFEEENLLVSKFCTQENCKCSFNEMRCLAEDISSKIEKKLPGTIGSQNAVMDDIKSRSSTTKSLTSLADAVQLPDERKISDTCCPDNADKSLYVSQSKEGSNEDLTDAAQNPGCIENEKPGFFSKLYRRIVSIFQGTKIDVWPGHNSQAVQQSFV